VTQAALDVTTYLDHEMGKMMAAEFVRRCSLRCFAAIPVALFSGCALFVTTVPPASATNAAMRRTLDQIDLYIQATGHAPSRLADLPSLDAADPRPTDGWGRPLIYSVDSSGMIVLESRGADGEPGGDDDDADITIKQLPHESTQVADNGGRR